jgi:hypothetical protein
VQEWHGARGNFHSKNCEALKEVTATGIKITRSTGHGRMGQNEDNVEQETTKRTEENRRLKYPECNNGIRDRDLKLRLRDSKHMYYPNTKGIERWSQGKRAFHGIGGIGKMTYTRFSVRRSWNM